MRGRVTTYLPHPRRLSAIPFMDRIRIGERFRPYEFMGASSYQPVSL
jgi:hypothetical protein